MAEEKNFENRIKKMLDKYGAWYVKYFGCGMTQAGVPDILCCIRGQFVAIEVKASKGRPSPLQLRNLQKIDEQHGFAILAYPDDFDLLECLVKAISTDDALNTMAFYAPFKDNLLTKINKFIKQD